MAKKQYKSLRVIENEFNAGGNRKVYESIPADDKTFYKWKCSNKKCGEVWETSKFQRLIAKKGECHYCTNQKVRKHESVGHLYPKLIKEWSSANSKSIYDYKPKNDTEVDWICRSCNTPYKRRINSRVNGNNCECSRSILQLYPSIAKELQVTDPKYITPGSHEVYTWKCQNKNCGHTWSDSVYKRINGSKNCRKCDGKIAERGTCLADTHRHLMDEWDFEKNKISPFSITSRNSSLTIEWKCKDHPNEHKWSAKLEKRISKKPTKCPYCYGTGSTSIKESIQTTHPEIAIDWHKTKNSIPISSIRAGSQKKVWWECNICKYEWDATPANRTGINKTGCKNCSDAKSKSGTSKIENNLRNELKGIFKINEKPHTTIHVFESKQRIDFDFYLEELPLAFDFDPHHTHKNRFKRDSEKSEKLKNYCNFFKLRESPLEKTSINDVLFNHRYSDIDGHMKLIFKKIEILFPHLGKEIKAKIEKYKKEKGVK
jgi:hypothetical protein